MKRSYRIGIVAGVLVAIAVVFAFKVSSASRAQSGAACCGKELTAMAVTPAATASTEGLPRLVDLGASKCIPCRLMAPILESLKTEQAGKLNVEFIDVWENPNAGKQYGVQIIPTQIFYDGQGKELFRHVGFYAKEDILNKWKELGVELNSSPSKAR